MRQPIVRCCGRCKEEKRGANADNHTTDVHDARLAAIRRERYRRTASLRSAADQDFRTVRTSSDGRTVRLAKASASFDIVLRITLGAVALEIVDEDAENATAVAVPVRVTEIAAVALAVAPPLSFTLTEIV
jgi:hypothetical protein